MTTTRLLTVLLVAIAATVAAARARRAAGVDPPARSFDVVGVVTAQPGAGRVTIAHADIPGYMPAMTMPFAVESDAPTLAPGDRVRFRLNAAGGSLHADRIVVTGRDDAVAAAAREATADGVRSARLKRGDALPAFSLTAEDGRAFTSADLRGRITAITFIFTRCPVAEFCPLMVKRFEQVQREADLDRTLQNVRLVGVTLDPAFDTPPVLAAYAKAMGARPERWRFLTGAASEIGRLTTAFSIHTQRNGVLLDHTLATAVVGADGRVVEIWRGNGWSARDVAEVLRREAASVR